MKLRCHITRREHRQNGLVLGRSVRLTYPAGPASQHPTPPERIITRNIGPRPWTELSFWENGQAVRVFAK